MRQQVIKDLHKVGNKEVKEILEEQFPETFEAIFDVEKYLKELIESANQININEDRVDFRRDGKWILDFRKDYVEYWIRGKYFEKIQQKTGLNYKETQELCTNTLSSLTEWDGCTTLGSSRIT